MTRWDAAGRLIVDVGAPVRWREILLLGAQPVRPATAQYPAAAGFEVLLLAFWTLLASMVLIPTVSYWVRRRYIRFVRAAMAPSSPAWDVPYSPVRTATPTVTPAPPAPWPAQELVGRARAAARRAARAYGLAGLAFGLWSAGAIAIFVMSSVVAIDTGSGWWAALYAGVATLIAVILAVLIAPLFAWLIVPTLSAIGLVGVRLSVAGWVLLGGYLVVLTAGTLGIGVIVVFVLLPGALIVLVAPAGVRGVAWFVTPVCLSVVALTIGAVFAATRSTPAEQLTALGVLLLVVLLSVGRLWSVVALYSHKRLSDDTLLITQWWFIQALVLAAITAIISVWAALGVLAAYAAFTLALSAGLRGVHRRALPNPPVRLLLLRTFGDQRRSTRLLSVLSAHWRWIGSIQVIAGPDLAAETLEPHELLDYVRRRMSGRFVSAPAQIGPRLDALDLAPDRDGRYRVNDVFCTGDVWQPTLQALVATSHAVLVDLRGFGPQHGGVVYELEQLALQSVLHRVVAIVDMTTSMAVVQYALARAGRLAAGSGPPAPGRWIAPRFIHVQEGRRPDAKRVFEALCQAAVQPAGPVSAG